MYLLSSSCTFAASAAGNKSARIYKTAIAFASALLAALAKIVAVRCHRKAEPDNQTQQRQRSGEHNAGIITIGFRRTLRSLAQKVAAPRRDHERGKGKYEH